MAINTRSISFSYREFELLADRRENGTPLGYGWGTYEGLTCPVCKHRYDYLDRIVGTKGFVCYDCGTDFPDFVWGLVKDLPIPSDGGFLKPVGWEHARTVHN